jgi:hypothetical protein
MEEFQQLSFTLVSDTTAGGADEIKASTINNIPLSTSKPRSPEYNTYTVNSNGSNCVMLADSIQFIVPYITKTPYMNVSKFKPRYRYNITMV